MIYKSIIISKGGLPLFIVNNVDKENPEKSLKKAVTTFYENLGIKVNNVTVDREIALLCEESKYSQLLQWSWYTSINL